MLTRLVAVALLAGVLTGLLTAGLQNRLIEPLIVEAEKFEHAPMNHDGMVMAPAAESAGEVAAVGATRMGITVIATIGAAVGYGLMLLALMVGSQAKIDWPMGLTWGACGFAACGLAPALGLAPELPGAAAADLTARQLWWAGTAIATAGGLWLILRSSQQWMIALGVLLLIAPHVMGAPMPAALTSTVPAETASAFTARSLGVQAVLWLTLGAATGWFWSRPWPNVLGLR
jgi:cobalt transporter subunit CbtA